MQRLLIVALLLVACRRQPGVPTGWGVGPDGAATTAPDPGGRSDEVATAAQDGATGSMMGQGPPPREFATPDAGADSLDAGARSSDPVADKSADASGDADGDGRLCPEVGHCD